jgi:tRNA(Phe) wybutosine-synthesizing methylase Tyw3
MLMTQKEMQILLDQINHNFSDQFARLDKLEKQIEELSNAKVEGSKTSTGRRKRVQQTKEDA